MTLASYRQSNEELRAHLDEQLAFLQASANSYDAGFDGEAKRIAVSIRVLMHDTRNSTSLLGQLDMKGGMFLDTSNPVYPGNMSTHSGLIVTAIGPGGARYCAFLDDGFVSPMERDFESWWRGIVFVDSKGRAISRKDLVLVVANQDGGAHIDPALDSTYADLSRRNSLGWTYSDGTSESELGGPEKAALRQICHEVLKTLIGGYTKSPEYPPDSVVTGGMTVIEVSSAKDANMSSGVSLGANTSRNERCSCGSGERFKRCCGKLA